MRKVLRPFLFFVILVFAAVFIFTVRPQKAAAKSAGADTSVQAIVESTTVAIGKPFELMIRVKTGSESDSIAEPRMPGLEGFQVIGRDQRMSSQMSIVNGDVQAQVVKDYVFTIAPEVMGKKDIGAAEVTVGGKTYQTKPIRMTVVAAGKVPQGNANSQTQQSPFADDDAMDPVDQMYQNLLKRRFAQLNGNSAADPQQRQRPGPSRTIPGVNPDEAFFIRVEADKTSVYVGEQITASWYLYTRNAIRNIDTLKYPDLKGFWKEDIELSTRLNFEDEVVNGIPYKRALLVSYALFPIKEGNALIDSYRAKCDVASGPFGMGQTMPYTKTSPELRVVILPLPIEGRTKDFTGAVGEFTLKTSIGSSRIETGQPFSFKVRLEGHGNAKSADLPPLDLPATVELYDTHSETKFFKTGESYKEFEVLLIPRVAGVVKLPAVTISTFDPKTKQYSHKTAPGITITVAQGKAGEKFSGSSSVQTGSGETKTRKENLALPLPVMQLSGAWLSWQIDRTVWIAIYALILLVLCAYAFRTLFGNDRKRDLNADLRKRLKLTQDALKKNDFRGVGTSGLNAINYLIGQHIQGEAGAIHETSKLLKELPPSLRNSLEQPLLSLVNYFESLSFAPETFLQDAKTPAQMEQQLSQLEKTLLRMIELGKATDSEEKVSNDSGSGPESIKV